MPVASPNLWDLTFGRPWVDPDDLGSALEAEVIQRDLDFRTRLLIRDSLDALARFWGAQRFEAWLGSSPVGPRLRSIHSSDLGPSGFPTLNQRVMNTLRPQTVLEFLRELGSRLSSPAQIIIGGSIALILSDDLSRATDDIDIVDEIPAEISSHHALLDELTKRYALRLTHFQSHFLPTGWRTRIRSLGRFGELDVFLIDSCDIFVGKLFSARAKDRDDLRQLIRRIDKPKIESRLRATGSALVSNAALARNATDNWYTLFGEPLPFSPSA
jgi:hypothetical protein